MGMQLKYIIKGLQESAHRNQRRIINATGRGAAGDAITDATAEALRLLIPNMPYDTTILKNSQRLSVNRDALHGQVFTSRNATNPKSGTSPSEYEGYLAKKGFKAGRRGGVLAAKKYTVQTQGADIQKAALSRLKGAFK